MLRFEVLLILFGVCVAGAITGTECYSILIAFI
jgi:hypothetical protein